MAYIIIPEKHQAAPRSGHIYLPHQMKAAPSMVLSAAPSVVKLYGPDGLVVDTELRSGLAVNPSIIHGLGLFAERYFARHEVIWTEHLKGRGSIEDEGPLRWANHSDNPNSLLVINSIDRVVEASLIALRDIAVDDEITYDYTSFGHAGEKKACNCQQDQCKRYFTVREEFGEKK